MNNTEQSQQRKNKKAASEVLYLDCDDSNSDSKNSSKQLSERNMPGNLEPTKKYDQAMQSQKATATSSAPSIMNITNNSSFNDLRPRKHRNRLVAPTNNHHVTDSDGGNGQTQVAIQIQQNYHQSRHYAQARALATEARALSKNNLLKARTSKLEEEELNKKKATMPKNDPNEPKRPKTAYLLFGSKHKAEIKAANPGIRGTKTSKLLGQKWKVVSKEGK